MMEKHELHTDVLVLGSGPSGFAAAYTAAKSGAKVIIVEQSRNIGGISTSGLMSHWTGNCGSPLYHEILNRSADKNNPNPGKRALIDPEKLKTLYLEMLCEVGVEILLYTFAADAITLVQMINNQELDIAYGDIPAMILLVFSNDAQYRSGTLSNILIGLLFAGLGVFALLRKTGKEVADTKFVDLT
jgi:hypothetical protein